MPSVLITGVSQRLGLHLAKHFLGLNYQVIGTYRTERDSIEKLRQQGVELHQLDFYIDNDVETFISNIISSHNTLDCLIHNASDWLPDNKDLDYTQRHEIFHKMMRVHCEIPYLVNLALQPLLTSAATKLDDSQSTTYSDIIHITDYVAFKGSKKHIAYAASKAAVENLTLSFAQRFAPTIKVNSIAPALLAFNAHDNDEYKIAARSKSLMQTEGSFDEASNTVDWLINSNYVTGRSINLDGGRHLK
ncbi:MAG: dihydromonapterin reductase [Kangiellaceae bacterium]|jgi:dihydromonapterin reductase/dihydrofolate reductase|nr:dihydromonapterin reductase [Kangiellaceae bacterium]